MSLFREQAIRALTNPPTGEPLIATPAGWRTGLGFTAAFLLLALTILCIIDVPRRTIATGVLVPTRGLTWVPSPAAGFIEAVRVQTGDVVQRGDVLFRMTTDSNADMDEALRAGLETEARALAGRLQLAREAEELANRTQQSTRDELEGRIRNAGLERRLQTDRLQLARNAVEAAEAMARSGVLPKLERDRIESSWIESRQSVQKLEAEIAELEITRAALPARQARERNELRSRISAIEQEVAALAQRQLELQLARHADVTATIAGRVIDVRPLAGAFVQGQAPQIAILPEGDQLRAELLVPSDALGFVHAGTPLRLHLESFPFQKFGAIDAVVNDVSPVLLPAARQDSSPLPVFRVFAALSTRQVTRAGRVFNLQPDMRLRAHVILERRRAWEWLLEPVLEAVLR